MVALMILNSCHPRESSSAKTGRAGCPRFLVCVTNSMDLNRMSQLTLHLDLFHKQQIKE